MINGREVQTIDLLDLIQVMLKKWWLILLCCIIGAGGAGVYTKTMIAPRYQASSMIFVLSKTTSVMSLADIQLGSWLTDDFSTIAKSRPVLENVAEDVEVECGISYTADQLGGMLKIENPEGTHILKITCTHTDPEQTRIIANAAAKETSRQIAEIMVTDAPTTVEKAITPKAPISPSLSRNVMMGAMMGGMLICGLLVLLYLLDDTIKSEEDVAKYLKLDTLAAFPMEHGRGRRNARQRKK